MPRPKAGNDAVSVRLDLTSPRFLAAIQKHVVRISIGPSTVRGRGNAGVGDRARAFAERLRLARFGVARQATFLRRLDRETLRLAASLPRSGGTWGLARKILNIVLRDCLYNVYLARAYRLARAEPHLELPLDSITAKRLREEVPSLPTWPGVRHLTPEVSSQYQVAAAVIAGRHKVARVHLDAFWWGGRSETTRWP